MNLITAFALFLSSRASDDPEAELPTWVTSVFVLEHGLHASVRLRPARAVPDDRTAAAPATAPLALLRPYSGRAFRAILPGARAGAGAGCCCAGHGCSAVAWQPARSIGSRQRQRRRSGLASLTAQVRVAAELRPNSWLQLTVRACPLPRSLARRRGESCAAQSVPSGFKTLRPAFAQPAPPTCTTRTRSNGRAARIVGRPRRRGGDRPTPSYDSVRPEGAAAGTALKPGRIPTSRCRQSSQTRAASTDQAGPPSS